MNENEFNNNFLTNSFDTNDDIELSNVIPSNVNKYQPFKNNNILKEKTEEEEFGYEESQKEILTQDQEQSDSKLTLSSSKNLLVKDLDSFFQNTYNYYYQKGYSSILLRNILDTIIVLLIINFIFFNFYIIDWKGVFKSCDKYMDSKFKNSILTKNNSEKIENLNFNTTNSTVFLSDLEANFKDNLTLSKEISKDEINFMLNESSSSDTNKKRILKQKLKKETIVSEKFDSLENNNSCNLILLIYRNTNIFEFIFSYSFSSLLYLLFLMYFALISVKTFQFTNEMFNIKLIYETKLGISEDELENFSFGEIIEKLIVLQKKENFCRIKENLTKFDIISRICRKENFLNMIISSKVIDLNLGFCDVNLISNIPSCYDKNLIKQEDYISTSYFNKILNILKFSISKSIKKFFNLNLSFSLMTNYSISIIESSILDFAFEDEDSSFIHKNFFNSYYLRIRILKNLLLELVFFIPMITIKVVLFFVRNAEVFSSKSTIKTSSSFDSGKKLKADSLIELKCFNELKEIYDRRIYSCEKQANDFISKFNSQNFVILSNFIALLCGSLLLMILIISILDENKLSQLKLFGFNLLYVLVGVGFLLGYAKNYSSNSTIIDKDEKTLYYKNAINSFMIPPGEILLYKWISHKYTSINNILSNNIVLMIKELFSFFMLPVICFKLFLQVDNIIRFIKLNYSKVDGLGDIVSGTQYDDAYSKKNKYFLNGILISEHISNNFIFRKQLISYIYYTVSFYLREQSELKIKKLLKK